MAYAEKKDNVEKKSWPHRICPKCKRKICFDRRYCICGTDMNWEPMYRDESIERPKMLEKRNLDLPYFSCDVCDGNCSLCHSYSVPNKNYKGWGGLDCEHKQNNIKCTCCQLMIKRWSDTPDINTAIKEALRGVGNILNRRNAGNNYTDQKVAI
jgi:hypothetical protein